MTHSQATPSSSPARRASLWERLVFVCRENPQLAVGAFLIGTLLLICLIATLHSYDPVMARGKGIKVNQGPSFSFFLGTDPNGESLFVLLVEGTSAFFFPGILATFLALLGGISLGAFSGYYGGWLAAIGRYIGTVINSFPNLILVLLLLAVFGQKLSPSGKMNLIALTVGITFIPHIAEEIRRKVAQLRAEEFVMAAEAHGLRDRRILFFHILWLHCTPLVLRQVVFLWGYLVILETSLSYMGGGVLEGISWGSMLKNYSSGFFYGRFWNPFVVLSTLMVTMTGFFLLSEGLQLWSNGIGRWVQQEDIEE